LRLRAITADGGKLEDGCATISNIGEAKFGTGDALNSTSCRIWFLEKTTDVNAATSIISSTCRIHRRTLVSNRGKLEVMLTLLRWLGQLTPGSLELCLSLGILWSGWLRWCKRGHVPRLRDVLAMGTGSSISTHFSLISVTWTRHVWRRTLARCVNLLLRGLLVSISILRVSRV